MANQISDNRTLVAAATAATTYVDLGGGGASIDQDVFLLGDRSAGFQSTNSRDGVMVDLGAATDVSNNVFYLWVNCGVVGLLDLASLGGFRVRFAGANTNDFFEIDIAGSDFWPLATDGGWVMFVVDIERAKTRSTTFGATGGTSPATNAIRYVGISTIQPAMGAKMVDNTWLNGVWRLPYLTPGIIIEGQNGGTTPWTSDDIVTAVGATSGIFSESYGGAYVFNTGVQIGIADTTTHAVDFSGDTWLFDNLGTTQANSDLRSGISALSASGGSVTVNAGTSSGSGNDLNGSGGWSISSAPAAFAAGGGANDNKWNITFANSSAGTETVNLYGSAFSGLGNITLQDPATTVAGTVFADVQLLELGSVTNTIGAFTNNTVSNSVLVPSPVALEKIINCSFIYGGGGKISFPFTGFTIIWATTPYDFIGNLFAGFGADGTSSAAIENASSYNITITIIDSPDTPTKLETNGTITFINAIGVTISGLLGNTEVSVLQNPSPYSSSVAAPVTLFDEDVLSAVTGTDIELDTGGGANITQILRTGTTDFTTMNLVGGDQVRVSQRSDLKIFDTYTVVGTPTASAITVTAVASSTSKLPAIIDSPGETVTVEKVNASYTFSVSTGEVVDILAFRVGSLPIYQLNQTISSTNNSFPLTQVVDRNFDAFEV